MNQHADLPHRRKLSHTIPAWVSQGARHFITINCQERGVDILCGNGLAAELLNSARYYEEQGRWYVWLMVVMPDHIHFIATFDLAQGLSAIVKAWKGYLKRKWHVEWQPDFFEHRLRNEAEFMEKLHYIRLNPVRKNYVSAPEAWPYILDRCGLSAVAVHRAARQGRLALPSDGSDAKDELDGAVWVGRGVPAELLQEGEFR